MLKIINLFTELQVTGRLLVVNTEKEVTDIYYMKLFVKLNKTINY